MKILPVLGTLGYRTRAQSRRRPPERISNAEIAEIAECLPGTDAIREIAAREVFVSSWLMYWWPPYHRPYVSIAIRMRARRP
jgi:hypothetical protein